jgi:hypothetical protein
MLSKKFCGYYFAFLFFLFGGTIAPTQGQQIEDPLSSEMANGYNTWSYGDGVGRGTPVSSCGERVTCGSRCGQCSPCRFYMGAEITVLEPNVEQARFLVSPGNDLGNTPPLLSDFSYGTDVDYLNVAPRVWLGYRSCSGLGFQTRFWQSTYANDFADDRFEPPFLDNDFARDTRSSLEMYTFDLEGTYDYQAQACDMIFTLGARHASFEQHDSMNSVTQIDNIGLDLVDIYSQRAVALRDFQGTGLTFSWAGSSAVNCKQNCSLFWNLRGSTLWGENKARAATSLMGTYFFEEDAASIDIEADEDSVSSDETLYILEAQLGIRWSYLIKGFNARMFAQVAAEYQYWNASGSNANVLETVRNIENSELVSVATTSDLDVGLIGFALSTGFAW